jgi:protoporphyrinogen/coproporphyrinogen III oxidase
MDDVIAGSRRVAIIGGGITGLAAAHRLKELAPSVQVTVLEAGARPGGVLTTERRDGFLIEGSSDSFITTFPWGVDLCRRMGIENQLLPTAEKGRRAFVVHNGRLQPIPDGLLIMAPTRIGPMLRTPILSPWGKLRMGCELFVRKGGGGDESLASFATRRFGREAFERLIQPLVSGMYTGDPARLSVRATMPRFLEMEQAHGSLIRAMRKGKSLHGTGKTVGSGARYGMFVTMRDGMSSLVDAVVARLAPGTVRCGSPVQRLTHREGGGWSLEVGGDAPGRIEADAVVVAISTGAAARLLGPVDPTLGERLGRINTTGSIVVSLAYRRDQVAHPLDGFGFVVPLRERLPILSGSFASVKFPDRSPEGTVLIRVFVGGSSRPEMIELGEDELIRVAETELGKLLGITGTPIARHVHRWPGVMPQYEVGHGELVASIEAAAHAIPGLEIAGNAYHGVGVPQCIHSGETAAERLAAWLRVTEQPSCE